MADQNNQTEEKEIPETESNPLNAEAQEKAEEKEELVPKSELLKVQAESDDFKRKWYNVTAEYENYRKRTASTKTSAYLDGKADILLKILPVADNLERALLSVKDDKTKEGIEMVLRNFLKVLESEGIESIDPVGEPFDPTYAEAIMASPAEEGEEKGMVKTVCLKGYMRKDKVLRFAQVVVTQ